MRCTPLLSVILLAACGPNARENVGDGGPGQDHHPRDAAGSVDAPSRTGNHDARVVDAAAVDSRAIDARTFDASLAPITDATVAADACAAYVAPTPCDTKNGLEVYCIAAGDSITFQAQVSYPAKPSVAALGVGSVFTGNPGQMTSLGYFLQTDPFVCVPTDCQHAIGYGNTGVGGKICEVSFDLTLPNTTIGTGMYNIMSDPAAADGDYLLGYATNTWTILTPDFYLRIGSPTLE